MPELPEVQTTVNGLQKYVVGFTITDIWTDLAVRNPIPQFIDTLKSKTFFDQFKKDILGQKITKIERRAKNILITLSNKHTILVHMKMTGHMMIGTYDYNKKENFWVVSENEKNNALRDPYNRFIHVVWTLQKGTNLPARQDLTKKYLVLCDARKFAKVTLLKTKQEYEKHLGDIGPEPLDATCTEKLFKERITLKLNGCIKTVLMNPEIIAGIGNIYSDEALWLSDIHPERKVVSLSETEIKTLFKNIKCVLNKGIDFGGDSTSDYRNIQGERGTFHGKHNVYRETGQSCKKKNCTGVIQRKIVNGRSAHFCPIHQK